MIRVERLAFGHARVALILLDRREKRNALTPDMLENIRTCANRLHADNDRPCALVLAGEGEAFCAGFDLSLCKDDPLAMAALLTKLSTAVRTLRRVPMPVVIAAHGAAIAGGCALLAGADFVVTDRAAKLGYPVVRLGISPAVNAPMLRLSIGDGHTHERLLDPTLISGEEALRIGLAHECVDEPGQVRERAIAIAVEFAAKPPHAVATTKRWLNELDGSDQDAAMEAALHVSLSLAGGEEESQRLAALWKG